MEAKYSSTDIAAIERSLAYSAARSDIEVYSLPMGPFIGGAPYWDTSKCLDEDRKAVDGAVAYLDARGLLDRDAQNPAIVSIRDESEAAVPDRPVINIQIPPLDLGPWPFDKVGIKASGVVA